MAKRAFISHISQEADLAKALKEVLRDDFLQMLDIFVSSDSESIAAGEPWLTSVEQALSDCAMLIIMCSPESIDRPWINFEAGAAWMRKIPLIPVCHSGLEPGRLPMPLSLRQAIALDDPTGLRRLYARIAEIISCGIPRVSFSDRATELGSHQVQQVSPVEKPTKASVAKPTPPGPEQPSEKDAILARLQRSLEHPEKKWRSVDSLAAEAATPPEVVLELLRLNKDVRFRKSKRTGKFLIGLTSKVGDYSRVRKT